MKQLKLKFDDVAGKIVHFDLIEMNDNSGWTFRYQLLNEDGSKAESDWLEQEPPVLYPTECDAFEAAKKHVLIGRKGEFIEE